MTAIKRATLSRAVKRYFNIKLNKMQPCLNFYSVKNKSLISDDSGKYLRI